MSTFQTIRKVHRTRKEHRCGLCYRIIPKNFSAINTKGMAEDNFFNEYLCNTCYKLQAEFPDYVREPYENYLDNSVYEDSLNKFECHTPLQLLNTLRKQKEGKYE